MPAYRSPIPRFVQSAADRSQVGVGLGSVAVDVGGTSVFVAVPDGVTAEVGGAVGVTVRVLVGGVSVGEVVGSVVGVGVGVSAVVLSGVGVRGALTPGLLGSAVAGTASGAGGRTSRYVARVTA